MTFICFLRNLCKTIDRKHQRTALKGWHHFLKVAAHSARTMPIKLGFRWSEIMYLLLSTISRKQVISYIKRWPCNGTRVRGWEWRWPSLDDVNVLVILQGHAAARSSLSDSFFTASFSNPRSYLQLLVRRSHLLRCPVIHEDVNAIVNSVHVLSLT